MFHSKDDLKEFMFGVALGFGLAFLGLGALVSAILAHI